MPSLTSAPEVPDPEDGANATVKRASRKAKLSLAEVRENARVSDEYWGKQYPTMQNDLSFLAGHQWDAVDVARRNQARRVTLTINDFGQYIDQIVGDLRQNPTSIQVIPSDHAGLNAKFLSTSGKNYDAAEVKMGLIRQIEYKSSAPDHYNLAGQHASESGLGYLRVYADYTDPTTFNQDICIERIRNRFSVMCDPTATQPDWSDQNYCFVGDLMLRKDFEREYPKATPTPLPTTDYKYWGSEKYVRLTEYYWREQFEHEIAQLRNGQIISDGTQLATEQMRDEAAALWDMAETGGHITRRRKVRTWRVFWAKVTYSDILEGPVQLPGTIIPVAPVIGKRIEGDEDTVHYGLIRFAKEPKRMENYWWTAATERIAQMPKAPWLVTTDQIEGYEQIWAEANTGMPAYLPYNAKPGEPAPQRVSPPSIAAGEMQMLMATRDMTKGAIGLHDAAIGKETNQQSGRALLALERSSDVGNFVFADNLRMAVSYVGRVLLEWLPVIYDSERWITIRHVNGEVDTIEVNKVQEDGSIINDMTAGQFDQHVTTGPAYSTLRQQAVATMETLYKAVPALVPATVDIFLSNMDAPGTKEMAARARKMVPKNLLDENELTEEEKNAPPPQPSPAEQVEALNAQAEQAKAEATMATAEATKVKAQSTIIVAEADVKMAGLETQRAMNDTMERTLDTRDNEKQEVTEREEKAKAETGDNAPVTLGDFEAFKTEIAAALAKIASNIGPKQ